MEVHTQSQEETRELGETLGASLIDGERGEKAKVIAFYGELGSGKTTFVQGLAKGLGIPHRILSPTFILVRRYPSSGEFFSWFYHIDLYRLEKRADLQGLGITEIFADPHAIAAIEWAERLSDLLPKNSIDLFFKSKTSDIRQIRIVNLYKDLDLAINW